MLPGTPYSDLTTFNVVISLSKTRWLMFFRKPSLPSHQIKPSLNFLFRWRDRRFRRKSQCLFSPKRIGTVFTFVTFWIVYTTTSDGLTNIGRARRRFGLFSKNIYVSGVSISCDDVRWRNVAFPEVLIAKFDSLVRSENRQQIKYRTLCVAFKRIDCGFSGNHEPPMWNITLEPWIISYVLTPLRRI